MCDKFRIFADETKSADENKSQVLMLENLSSGYIHHFIGLFWTWVWTMMLADS